MADNKKSAVIYTDWINIFEELEDAEAGQLIKHLFRYINDKNPEAPSRLIKLIFEPLKQSLKRDLVKYEDKRLKNIDNANKRWHKNNAVACDGINGNANHAVSDSVSVSVSVNDSVSVKKKNNIFIIPTFSEISDYCQQRKNKVDPEKFFNHYESNGWIVGKTKMKNWKAAIHTWEKNSFEIKSHKNEHPERPPKPTPYHTDWHESDQTWHYSPIR